MGFSQMVRHRIEKYSPQGLLDHTAKLFLSLCGVEHNPVKEHIERVALLAEAVAEKMGKDKKAAFFAGLLHDTGKILLPKNLFDGHDISQEEYAEVKTHATSGYKALARIHKFTALCAGLHHALYKAGYGLAVQDFPKEWGPATIKKVLEISMIVSICDFVDAFNHRKTKIRDGSDLNAIGLKEMLYEKYPDDRVVADIAIEEGLKQLEKEAAAKRRFARKEGDN